MNRRLIVIALLLLAGCAHYEPHALTVDSVVAQGQPSALDPQTVSAELARLAPGRQWDGAHWDETTLLAAAFAYNPDLRAARAGAEAAFAEAKAVRVRPGLTLTLTAEYAFNPTEASPWLFGLATDQLLDLGGRRRARIAEADISAKAAAFSLGNAAWSARAEIATAVAFVAASSKVAALFDAIAPLRTRQVEALRKQLSEGAASTLDLERIRQAAASDATAGAAARSDFRAAQLSLAKAVGAAPAAIDGLLLDQGVSNALTALSPELRSGALKARPDIFEAVVAYDRSEEALRAAVAAQYPEIRVGSGYTWERGLSKLPFNLTLAFPSADFGTAGIAAAEARREEAARKLEASVASAQRGVDAGFETYRAARETYQIVRKQTLPAAQAIAAQADRALGAGAMDRSTWADAKIGALTAEIDLARAQQALTVARVALEGALRHTFADPQLTQSLNFPDQGATRNE